MLAFLETNFQYRYCQMFLPTQSLHSSRQQHVATKEARDSPQLHKTELKSTKPNLVPTSVAHMS